MIYEGSHWLLQICGGKRDTSTRKRRKVEWVNRMISVIVNGKKETLVDQLLIRGISAEPTTLTAMMRLQTLS